MRPALLALTLAVAGCSSSGADPLLVSAAASLTDAMNEMAEAYESASGTEVVLNFAGSSSLREQILAGAAVDVYASADISNMDPLASAGLVAKYRIFATNRLQIAVPIDNPAEVTGLEDLANPALFVGLCALEVPCGSYGMEAFAIAGVVPSVDTYETDVRALLTKVREGELDAGLVYATDVASDALVTGVDVPEEHNVLVSYPIAAISTSANPEAATGFLEFALSGAGRAVLSRYGFSIP